MTLNPIKRRGEQGPVRHHDVGGQRTVIRIRRNKRQSAYFIRSAKVHITIECGENASPSERNSSSTPALPPNYYSPPQSHGRPSPPRHCQDTTPLTQDHPDNNQPSDSQQISEPATRGTHSQSEPISVDDPAPIPLIDPEQSSNPTSEIQYDPFEDSTWPPYDPQDFADPTATDPWQPTPSSWDTLPSSDWNDDTIPMGNLCSRSSNEPDPFSTPGRTLGSSAPSQPPKPTASVPSNVKSSPGRTLGGSGTTSEADNDAAARARKAAEERAKSAEAKRTGKLGQQLAEQQRKTQSQLLKDGSETERRNRDADQAQEARAYN